MNQHKESDRAARSCRKRGESGLFVSTVSAAETCPGSLPGTSCSLGSGRGCRDHPATHGTGHALCNCECKSPGKSPAEPLQAGAWRMRHGQDGQALAGCWRAAYPSRLLVGASQPTPSSPAAPHPKEPRRHHTTEHQLHLPLAVSTLRSQLQIWDTSVQAPWDR